MVSFSKTTAIVLVALAGCAQAVRTHTSSVTDAPSMEGVAGRKLMNAGGCASTYTQCGGQNAVSQECCSVADICKEQNPFYFQCVPDPDPPTGPDCAVRFDVCGGRFSPSRSCCRPGDECVFVNDFYSQCQPPPPSTGGAPGEKCKIDKDCDSNICDSSTGRCNFACDPSLKQEIKTGECTCQAGFIDVNTGDGTFCAALCSLSQMQCSKDADCCDSNVNVSCQNSKCTVEAGTCGSNQSKDAEGECKCNDGFIDVASNDMGISAPDPFCVPDCTVTGNLCDSGSSCCSQFGKVGFCMIMDNDTEGICALTPAGPTTARIANSIEATEMEEVPQTAAGALAR